MTLLRTVFSLIGRYFLIFLLVLLIIVFGPKLVRSFEEAIGEYDRVSDYLTSLPAVGNGLENTFESERRHAEARAREFQHASSEVVAERIEAIERELRVRNDERFKPHVEITRRGLEVNVASIKAKGQNEGMKHLLQYERDFLQKLHSIVNASGALERLRLAHEKAYAALSSNEAALAQLRALPIYKRLPGSDASHDLKKLEQRQESLVVANLDAWKAYESFKERVDRGPKKPLSLSIPTTLPPSMRAPLQEAMDEVTARERRNWWIGRHLSGVTADVKSGVVLAVQIVLLAIVTGVGIKAFFYFILAPLASRRPPVAVIPSARGVLEPPPSRPGNSAAATSTSRTIGIDASNELLVHQEYLQSTPHEALSDTKLFLSNRYWIASLAADLCGVTRLRSDTSADVVLSATHDPLKEIETLAISAGTAVVLQPRHIVGVLQPRNSPAHITSHWRLSSLHAWLTLQLRYLAFHGPATVILTGCRGVRIEPAKAGRSINQAATIGFSANLGYFSRRSETFFGYLSGKQPLLHDSFTGDGSYIYQEVPSKQGKSGVTGKGLEGLTDALLKVVGI